MSKRRAESAADSVHRGLTPEQFETADRLFARAIRLKRAQGRIDDRTDMFELPEELPLLSKCEWLWSRLFPNVAWELTKVAIWLEVECGVSRADSSHLPLDKLFELLNQRLEPQRKMPAAKDATPPKKKKRWIVAEIQRHCEIVMQSNDQAKKETYLFEEGKKLAKLIGCNAKTLARTEFWKERSDAQAKWRRENSSSSPRRKQDSQ